MAIKKMQKTKLPLRMSWFARTLPTLLNVGISDHHEHQYHQSYDDRMREPAETVTGHRYEEIGFDDFAENEAQHKGRPGPTEKHHKITEHSENQSDNQIGNLPVRCIAADKYQQQNKRNDEAAAHVSQFRELIEYRQRKNDRNHIGNSEGPNHREGKRKVLGQHFRSRHDTHNEKTAEQDCHGAAPRHTESNRRNQLAAFFGIVGRAGTQYTANISFAESAAFLRIRRALNRMCIRHPLRHTTAGPRHDADENTDDGATKNKPKMAEGIFDAFHDAAAQIFRRSVARNGSAANRQIDDFRNGEDTDENGDKIEPVPEIHHAEVEPKRAGLPFLADGRYEQAEESHG